MVDLPANYSSQICWFTYTQVVSYNKTYFSESFIFNGTNGTIRSDEGLTLERPAFESLYCGQFTLSTQLMKPNYLFIEMGHLDSSEGTCIFGLILVFSSFQRVN